MVAGLDERAVHLFSAAAMLRAAVGAPLPPVDQAAHSLRQNELRRALGDQVYAATWMAGQSLLLAEAITIALSD